MINWPNDRDLPIPQIQQWLELETGKWLSYDDIKALMVELAENVKDVN